MSRWLLCENTWVSQHIWTCIGRRLLFTTLMQFTVLVVVKQFQCRGFVVKQSVHVATQYASTPCKLTISSHLFARWWCHFGITISSYLFARWHLFRHVGYLRHQQQVDLWPWKWVRVMCDLGYLCINFTLPRPLCSQVRPDVRNRQTSDKSIT